jgi:hypothetical protein
VLFDAWFFFSRFEGLGNVFACHHSFVCILCTVLMKHAYSRHKCVITECVTVKHKRIIQPGY